MNTTMTLTKFKPRRSFLADNFFPTAFDSMFTELMRDTNTQLESIQTPAAEVVEDDHKFAINVMFAGFEKKDIKIDMQDNELIVVGEKSETKEEKNEKYHLSEFRSGKFRRSFYLPDSANMDKAEAELKNGILNVTIPKKAKAKVKEISIK